MEDPEFVETVRRLLDRGAAGEVHALCLSRLECGDDGYATLKYLGVACTLQDDWERGRVVLEAALHRHPAGDAYLFSALSICALRTGRAELAKAAAERAVEHEAASAGAQTHLGNALNELGDWLRAVEALTRAVALDPYDAAPRINLANSYRGLNRPDLALGCIDEALRLEPQSVDARYNRGNVLQDLDRFDEAILSYGQALALQPGHVGARWNRSLCLLRLGRFAQGWAEYESRWDRPDAETPRRALAAPPLVPGAALQDRTLHLHCEQGYGDCIQFFRFIPALHRLGARVVVEAYPALVPLLSGVEGVAEVRPFGARVEADVQCPLLSLAGWRSDWSAPQPVGGYIAAAPGKLARVRGRLGPRTRFRVGIVNRGSPTHKDDARRSLPLAQLAERLPQGLDYVLVQHAPDPRDAAAAQAHAMTDCSGLIDDFGDTAAVLDQLDLLVSVDTSAAHLAGALGRPVLTLLQYDADWRWGTRRRPHRWYASMTLLRQTARDSWDQPLAEVASRLEALRDRG